MNVIELKNVTKIYRKDFWAPKITAVADLTFSIKKGLVTGFAGPNGAGKTTVIKMIMGLVRPSAGTVTICGTDSFCPRSRKGVAYLCEQPYLYAHLTVAESLRFVANLIGLKSNRINEEINRVLSIVGMAHWGYYKTLELSKGMQQRLSMAQALLGDPQILILDEPMSGMDPPGRRLFRSIFNQLASSGKTVFFSTHVLDDIESVCDQVIVLSQGKLSLTTEISTLLAKGFLGTEMVISDLLPEDMNMLKAFGCEFTCANKTPSYLFLPDDCGCDLSKVQHFLFEKKATINSVTRRNKSLEELLYQKEKVLT